MEQQGANLSGLPERAAPEYYEIVQLITWELQSKFSKEDETSKEKKLREKLDRISENLVKLPGSRASTPDNVVVDDDLDYSPDDNSSKSDDSIQYLSKKSRKSSFSSTTSFQNDSTFTNNYLEEKSKSRKEKNALIESKLQLEREKLMLKKDKEKNREKELLLREEELKQNRLIFSKLHNIDNK